MYKARWRNEDAFEDVAKVYDGVSHANDHFHPTLLLLHPLKADYPPPLLAGYQSSSYCDRGPSRLEDRRDNITVEDIHFDRNTVDVLSSLPLPLLELDAVLVHSAY